MSKCKRCGSRVETFHIDQLTAKNVDDDLCQKCYGTGEAADGLSAEQVKSIWAFMACECKHRQDNYIFPKTCLYTREEYNCNFEKCPLIPVEIKALCEKAVKGGAV